jgi:hypothetical protein
METCKIYIFEIHNSITSSLSKTPSHSPNSFFKWTLASIKSTKLEGFATYPKTIGPNFVEENQFVKIF